MIFVTGGTGLLGNNVVRELLSRGEKVRVLCRETSNKTAFEGLDVDVVHGDVAEQADVSQCLADCEAVVHCAAHIHIGWSQLEQSRRVNVDGTRHVVEAALQAGKRLVFVSTVDTLLAATDESSPVDERNLDGVPLIPCSYVVSKSEAEIIVRDAVKRRRLDAIILHPGFMLGPFDWKPSSGRMMLQVVRSPMRAAPPGGCSVCDARNVAAAAANAISMGRAGQNYILAGKNMRYIDLWREMLRVAGKGEPFIYPLRPRIAVLGRAYDQVSRLLGLREGDINGASIAMGNLLHYYDSTLATKELDYTVRPLDETLRDTWQWLSAHHSSVRK